MATIATHTGDLKVPTTWVALAWASLHGDDEAGRSLAQLVLKAAPW